MVLRLLIDAAHADETRVAIVDNGRINDFDFVTATKKQLKGNIYLAKITRVEPSLQAAFVEYGSGKQGFLPFAEIHPDYYQIPIADREQLLKEFEDSEEEHAPGESQELKPEEHNLPEKQLVQEESRDPEDVFLQAEERVMAQIPTELKQKKDEIAPEDIFLASADFNPSTEKPTVAGSGVSEAVIYSEVIDVTPENHGISDVFEALPTAQNEENTAFASENQEEAHENYVPESEVSDVETRASEEEMVQDARKEQSFFRRYKIQEVIKRNQIVLVQVIKEERGNKGVSLTTFMSLAGRYCVLMPNSLKGGGISRKISSGEDRRRLREISAELKITRGMSAIIRTAGIDRSRAEIQRDYDYLLKLWENIREQTLASSAPALIYEESDIIKRTIRDLYSNEIEEIIVAGETEFEQTRNFMNLILPGNTTEVKLHNDNVPLFYAYNIEEQLNSMYDHIVKLRSGGYIVINPTEALISIDVNSGRATGERNIEETASKTNFEAAVEIARQLRLRDLAGLIVIDFIDMNDSRNRRMVERAIKDALKVDRAKIQIGRISPFGLLEMSRQRLRPSISETSTVTCTHCHGRGIIRSNASSALQIIRALEKEASGNNIGELKLFIPTAILVVLLNTRREEISRIEQKYAIKIIICPEDTILNGNYRIERVKGNRRPLPNGNVREPVSMENTMMEVPPYPQEDMAEPAADDDVFPAETEASQERPRRNRKPNRNRRPKYTNDNPQEKEVVAGESTDSADALESNAPRQSEDREGRPNRNKRSRKWRDRRDRSPQEGNGSEETPSTNASVDDFIPKSQSFAPSYHASVAHDNSALPPLEDQASKDGKPKKGWWRRIVDA